MENQKTVSLINDLLAKAMCDLHEKAEGRILNAVRAYTDEEKPDIVKLSYQPISESNVCDYFLILSGEVIYLESQQFKYDYDDGIGVGLGRSQPPKMYIQYWQNEHLAIQRGAGIKAKPEDGKFKIVIDYLKKNKQK